MKKSISIILAILMCFSCFSIISFAETTDSEHITTVPEGYVGIYTKDDLDNIKLDLSGKYILMNDIVFTEEDYAEGGSFYNSGKGWSPIGTEDYPFKGTFNGNGYSIVNLQINNPNETHQGLFGYIYTATVKQVTLANANIIGGSYIGGIIGEAEYGSKISNCIFSGIVQGVNCVGGIAGQLTVWGNSYGYYSSVTIEKCANTGTINGVKYVGGIVGYTQSHSSYNSGSTYVYVKNCFNAGYIYATNIAAGISCDTGYSKVQNCLSVEEVSAKNASPITNGGTTTFCYYLDETTADYTGTHGTPKSDDQLRKKGTFEQWDFDTVWTMEGREDYPYPELRDAPLVLPDDKKTEISAEISIVGDGKVGSVLSADIKNLAPENATYSYEWTVGNTVVSTEETYTVAQSDVNKDIILTIKGNGDFKGKISSEALTGICVHNAEEFTYNNDATCTKNGTNTATCLLCGEEFTVEAENTIVSHTFENYIYQNDATCTNDGTSVAKCEYCDATDSKTADGTKTGHSFYEAWIIDKEATCSEEGIKSHHCKNCDAKTDETALKKLAHEHSATVTNATCSENGKIVYTCICGDTYTEIIYASGHIDNDGDSNCDSCYEPIETEENDEPECKCICHEKGIFGIVYKILVTVQRYFKVDLIGKVFKMGRLCECGEYHY